MKIKTNKKMRLDELIKYIFDNDEENRVFIDDGEDFAVHTTSSDAAVNIERLKGDGGKKCISKRDTFTVEIEEELTEDTGIPGATFVYYYTPSKEVKAFSYSENARPTINHTIKLHHENKALAIYVGPTLIWSRETGIPESGVLEVSE